MFVQAMLENLSLMEPAAYNYAQFHVENKELLESLRATAAQTGPCSEVVDPPHHSRP
jgi:hypothetical protein